MVNKSFRKIKISLLVFILVFTSFFSAMAANVYTINGVNVSYSDFSSSPSECWAYANNIYNKIWGQKFSNSFSDSNNALRNLSDSELTLTQEHLKEYVSNAELGAVLRVCDSEYLHGTDGWGHSQIIVQKDSNGFTVFEGGLSASPYCREKYYTWSEYCNTSWLQYEYIKYIKWPGANAYVGDGSSDGSTSTPVNPQGCLDSLTGGNGTITISGWAFDKNAVDTALEIHVYVGGPYSDSAAWGTSGIIADEYRPDVNSVYGVGDYHGFNETISVPLTGTYKVYVYAINVGGYVGTNYNTCIGSGTVTIGSASASTEISLSDHTTPTTIITGETFIVQGTVSSGATLTDVTVGCYDYDGNMLTGKSVNPNSTTYNLKNSDASVKFGTLSPGVYFYRITATNAGGTTTLENKTFIVLANGPTVEDGVYLLKAAADNTYVVEVDGHGMVDETNLLLGKDEHCSYQGWKVEYIGNGYYALRNIATGLNMDVYGGGSLAGTNVQLYTGNGTAGQHWQILSAGDAYCLVPRCAVGMCLDIEGGTMAEGTNVRIWEPNLSTAERFSLVSTANDFGVISGIRITNITASGFDIVCTVTKETASVSFPTWTGSSSVVYHGATLSGNTATCHVNFSEHNNTRDMYFTHIYAYAADGTQLEAIRIEAYMGEGTGYNVVSSAKYNGSQYLLFDGDGCTGVGIQWTEAATYCQSIGGHLATITSAEENAVIAEMVAAYGSNCWLGANDVVDEGVYVWESGEAFSYTNWTDGEPNNANGHQNYLKMYTSGFWDDAEVGRDAETSIFICEMPVEDSVSGTCGDSLTWTLKDGTLTISGSGSMNDFETDTQPWNDYENEITAVVIEGAATTIGRYAFYECENLKEIEISESVTTINGGAFAYCTSLTEVDVPDTVITMEASVFAGCSNLTNVQLSESLTSIGANAFRDCTSLTEITIPKNVTALGTSAFMNCYALEKAVILGNIEAVNPYLFSQCKKLSSVTLPNSVSRIYDNAFLNCRNLAEIMIPVNVTVLGEHAFDCCTSLKSITIPSSVSTIGIYAFWYCTSLSEIYFEGSAPEIGEYALEYVTATAYYPAADTSWTEETKQGYGGTITWSAYGEVEEVPVASGYCGSNVTWSLNADGALTIAGSGSMKNYGYKSEMPWYSYIPQITSVVIENGVTSIGDYAFYGMTSMTQITIPEGVTRVGDYAFKNCTALNGVVLPSTLTYLGESAFYACSALTGITIPEGIYTVWAYTFKNCTGLAEVNLPSTLVKIDEAAFYGCSSLRTLDIPDSVMIIGIYTFKNCSSLNSVSLPSSLTQIREAAFYGTALTGLEVPEGVTKVDAYAFKNCTSLATLNLPSSLTKIGEAAFYGSSVSELTIPDAVSSIGSYAFKNCTSLKSVYLPSSLTKISEASFYNCSSLQTLNLPDKVTSIGNYAFRKCEALRSVKFSSGLTSIGESSFYGCTSLLTLNIPAGVTEIQGYAFKSCTGLEIVELPDSLVTIGESGFYGCTILPEITIPVNVETIGAYAFSRCTGLTGVVFTGDAPAIGAGAFSKVKATVTYPSGNVTWTADVMQNYGGTLNWVTEMSLQLSESSDVLNSAGGLDVSEVLSTNESSLEESEAETETEEETTEAEEVVTESETEEETTEAEEVVTESEIEEKTTEAEEVVTESEIEEETIEAEEVVTESETEEETNEAEEVVTESETEEETTEAEEVVTESETEEETTEVEEVVTESETEEETTEAEESVTEAVTDDNEVSEVEIVTAAEEVDIVVSEEGVMEDGSEVN